MKFTAGIRYPEPIPVRTVTRSLFTGLLILGLLLLLVGVLSLSFGAAAFGFGDMFAALAGNGETQVRFILLELRLPRTLASAFVGAALAGSGAVYQSLLRNPLADPYILGISGGAAVGAVFALTLGAQGSLSVASAAFAGSVFAMLIVYGAARRQGRVNTETLLLVGVIANAFFNALLLFLQSLASDEGIVRATYWMMGNLRSSRLEDLQLLGPVAAVAAAVVLRDARSIHVLQLGAETAWHLGIDVRRTERRMYIAASLLTAAAVTLSGLIGFVGLIVPHILRRVFGTDFRVLFPLSLLGGALLLVVSDGIARTAIAPAELPVGVLTAMLGGPFFIYLLRRRG